MSYFRYYELSKSIDVTLMFCFFNQIYLSVFYKYFFRAKGIQDVYFVNFIVSTSIIQKH